MKTNDLKKEIFEVLVQVNSNVYYRKSEAVYPKIVFSLDNKESDGCSDTYQVDIDIWGKETSDDVDDLADQVEDKLDRLNLTDTEHSPIITLIGRTYVDDQDKDIIHILVRVTARTY